MRTFYPDGFIIRACHSFPRLGSIFVRGASLELLYVLAGIENVVSIDLNRIVAHIDQPVQIDLTHDIGYHLRVESEAAPELLWNLKQINADKAWEITRGEGVRALLA